MQESKDIQQILCTFANVNSCGLMQESKDIQLGDFRGYSADGCGLMQESKDIQRASKCVSSYIVVV